jgi:hypothetical protein
MRTFRIPEPREHPDGEADDAEKAVRPHRSHYQPRRATGRFTQAGPVYHRPRDLGGRFRQRLLPEERAEAAAHTNQIIATELSPRLQRHLSLYELGRISSSEWHKACAQDIAYFYEQAYRAGRQSVGDPAVRLTPQDKAIVGRLVRGVLEWVGNRRSAATAADPLAVRADDGTLYRLLALRRPRVASGFRLL